MNIGISSSCFYPEITEKAFEKVCKLGAKTAEIFFNSSEELVSPIINEIKNISEFYSTEIRTIHPFTSFAEPFMIYGGYERRTKEGLDFYKRYFEAAQKLGSEAIVIHGGKPVSPQKYEQYVEASQKLVEIGKEYSVLPAFENVNLRMGSDLDFLKLLKKNLKNDFKTVLDIKQCRRSGVSEFEFIKSLGESIIQVHISDYDDNTDCIPPYEGKYDFRRLFSLLKEYGYDKSAVIELYEWSFESEKQIKKSFEMLENAF